MAQIIDEADAPEAIATLKQSGIFVVLHTGCYEILHAGHMACFKAGKAFSLQGKRTALVVGVESDSTLCLNREDKTRPLFRQQERCEAIANVGIVSVVIRFNPLLAIEYGDIVTFTSRLKQLSPDAMLVSYNPALSFTKDIMYGQTRDCAEAGILILPVSHHVRTHATDAVDFLNRPSHIASSPWSSGYDSLPSR